MKNPDTTTVATVNLMLLPTLEIDGVFYVDARRMHRLMEIDYPFASWLNLQLIHVKPEHYVKVREPGKLIECGIVPNAAKSLLMTHSNKYGFAYRHMMIESTKSYFAAHPEEDPIRMLFAGAFSKMEDEQ